MHSQIWSYELWLKSLRWLARAGSLVTIIIVAMFIIGEGGTSSALSTRDLIGLALFPGGVALGMLMAWRHEVEGSLFSIGSLAGFYIVCQVVLGKFPSGWAFLVFTSPAFLFLMSGLMERARVVGHQNPQVGHP
jgi:hypothetical protein